jgi:hypothetical protein
VHRTTGDITVSLATYVLLALSLPGVATHLYATLCLSADAPARYVLFRDCCSAGWPRGLCYLAAGICAILPLGLWLAAQRWRRVQILLLAICSASLTVVPFVKVIARASHMLDASTAGTVFPQGFWAVLAGRVQWSLAPAVVPLTLTVYLAAKRVYRRGGVVHRPDAVRIARLTSLVLVAMAVAWVMHFRVGAPACTYYGDVFTVYRSGDNGAMRALAAFDRISSVLWPVLLAFLAYRFAAGQPKTSRITIRALVVSPLFVLSWMVLETVLWRVYDRSNPAPAELLALFTGQAFLWTPLAAMSLCWFLILHGHIDVDSTCSGACRFCGYDLRGNTSGVCPECGTPIRTRRPQRE